MSRKWSRLEAEMRDRCSEDLITMIGCQYVTVCNARMIAQCMGGWSEDELRNLQGEEQV